MNKEEIENIISDILVNDGADGHCDGANIIADFVVSLLNGKGKDWEKKYFITKKNVFTKTKSIKNETS